MSIDVVDANTDRPTKVLIVEDSITFAGILKRSIQSKLDVELVSCRDYASTEEYLKNGSNEFFVALLDIVLPDAPNGEVVDLVVSHEIPSIVFTGEISDELRSSMWSKRIVDYVQKVNFDDIEHVVTLVDRLRKNIFRKVLIVDDSNSNRTAFRDLLQVYNFQVLEAENGKEALSVLKDEEVQLIISDYYMPVMNGVEFVKEVRRTHSKAKLPIIGFSSAGGGSTSAEFLKGGANDYFNSPLVPEEFYCRVSNTVDTAEYINTIKTISDNDSLTGIFTRSALFKYGEKLFAQQKRTEATLAAVMIDIDNLRTCNDAYGQFVGDEVIRYIAEILGNRFRKGDVVSRYGDDAFCILCADMKIEYVESVFRELASKIASTSLEVGEHVINTTVCVGIYVRAEDSLEDMISGAENVLRDARKKGREALSAVLAR